MKHTKTIGYLLAYNRKKHKMSQDEVAQLSGISRQRLSYIENDREIPNITESTRLAEIFRDIRIIQAICMMCQAHKTLLNIAFSETPQLQEMSDLRTVVKHFVDPIQESCLRIIELATFVKDPTAQHEQSLLIIEECNRIQFLSEALGLLTTHLG
jgi:transcriptional regulator with XRE-family HTH domain